MILRRWKMRNTAVTLAVLLLVCVASPTASADTVLFDSA